MLETALRCIGSNARVFGEDRMRSLIRTLCVLVSLLVSDSAFAQRMPTLPPPLAIPNCPEVLLGIVGDTHYYSVKDCPTNITGFGQSNTNFSVPCCSGNSCLCSILPLVGRPLVENAKDCMTMSIAEMKSTLDDRIAYMERLLELGERESRNGRINSWLPKVRQMKAYMDNTSIPEEERKKNFCEQFVPKNQAHEFSWNYTVLELNGALRTSIGNSQQPRLLKASEAIFQVRGGNVSVDEEHLIRVMAGEKYVYFKVFRIWHPGQRRSIQIGVQIEEPKSEPGSVPPTVSDAIMSDRHNHGHRVVATLPVPSGGTKVMPFLVSSYTDLAIP